MVRRIARAWVEFWCGFNRGHNWRPAVIRYVGWPAPKAVRFCEWCEKIEPVTLAEFYAQFGRMPW